jgi:hypothetical protein
MKQDIKKWKVIPQEDGTQNVEMETKDGQVWLLTNVKVVGVSQEDEDDDNITFNNINFKYEKALYE